MRRETNSSTVERCRWLCHRPAPPRPLSTVALSFAPLLLLLAAPVISALRTALKDALVYCRSMVNVGKKRPDQPTFPVFQQNAIGPARAASPLFLRTPPPVRGRGLEVVCQQRRNRRWSCPNPPVNSSSHVLSHDVLCMVVKATVDRISETVPSKQLRSQGVFHTLRNLEDTAIGLRDAVRAVCAAPSTGPGIAAVVWSSEKYTVSPEAAGYIMQVSAHASFHNTCMVRTHIPDGS